MATDYGQLFSTNPGNITDFSGRSAAEIFNASVVPRVSALEQLFAQSNQMLDARRSEREKESAGLSLSPELLRPPQEDDLDRLLGQPPPEQQDLSQFSVPQEDYSAPLPAATPASAPAPTPVPDSLVPKGEFRKSTIKLSNYGYASDSSPDYNSNVLKIGHSNNKLEDGVSAALTRSLAKRMGIPKGGWFEAVTSDGTVYRRRYDDTVPVSYKGKALPETVDLYNVKGSNSFGGKIVGIRPLTQRQ